jgi:hypothetical protein
VAERSPDLEGLVRVRRRIAVLNRSTAASDQELEAIVQVLQHELDRKFAEAWGTGAILTFVPKASDIGWQGKWNVVVVDTMEVAGALGYHDLTPEGQPAGFAGAVTVRQYEADLGVTISHEIFEMLGDADVNQNADDGQGRLCWYENADPVEADELAIDYGDVKISDYVYPSWFVPSLRGRKGLTFDRQKVTSEPFQLTRGGYIGYTETWPPNWQQEFAEGTTDKEIQAARPGRLSRRTRRTTPRREWRRSEP